MALKKVARTEQWQTRRKGAAPATFVVASDGSQHHLDSDSGNVAAYIVYDSDLGIWRLDTARGARNARLVQAGGAVGRALE